MSLISCNLMGGLGNQMFQAAHALCQGWKHNREVVFLPKSWTPMQGRDTSNYKNNVFRNFNFVDVLEDFTKVYEGPWEFTEVNPLPTNTVFEGYFQSGKNFLGFDENIKEYFGPTEEFKKYALEKYPKLSTKNTVSVHVRFGDYKQNPHIHPSITKEYIDEALLRLGNDYHIFLFGDDKNWLLENFQWEYATLVNEEDYADMWIMSMCESNIIANSTFSWWGAFLNRNSNKKVFAPSIWFGPSGPQNYYDMYQDDWTKIDVEYINGELKPKK